MLCCKNCFNSPYVKAYISSLNQQGECDYCESNNVHVCDISDVDFGHMFEGLSKLHIEDIESSIWTIDSILWEFWSIFNPWWGSNRLLSDIFITHKYPIFDNAKLVPSQKIHLTKWWDNFTNELKNTNRFHITNALDLEEIEYILINYHTTTIDADNLLYRSRISRSWNLYNIQDLGMPPINKVSSKGWRINPIGIPYLYLSGDVVTTFYETRASHYDQICTGKFIVLEDLILVDLRKDSIDFMRLSEREKIEDYYPYIHFISRMSNEFSKPNLKDDKELDYLPTQYIAEFLKVLWWYDGLIYDSSLNPQWYNIALFRDNKVRCEDITIYSIDAVNFNFRIVT